MIRICCLLKYVDITVMAETKNPTMWFRFCMPSTTSNSIRMDYYPFFQRIQINCYIFYIQNHLKICLFCFSGIINMGDGKLEFSGAFSY